MESLITRDDLGAGTARTLSHLDFSGRYLPDIEGKKVIYSDCNFSYSIIERGYFHKAVFTNCKFIGARIRESIFRSATFENCDFSYVDFHRCVLPVPQILANLPTYPNVRWELLHNLRANTHSIGDTTWDADIVYHEARTEIEHWRGIANAGAGYYQKYSLQQRLAARLHHVRLLAERYIWGHGESLCRLALSTIFFLMVLGFFHTIGQVTNLETASIGGLLHQYFKSLSYLASLYVDLPNVSAAEVSASPFTSVLAVILRYASIGLAVPVLYKFISRR
ncbi:hypothetical protein PMI35_02298 [Pseudomonas sp. GM78]|uniref:pentapeptide repeat-containing protein n=1 Tax=Pseudomonas sp. GM78 TaxID=1144337 RepID=UPI0002707A1A|nr:pentapeptide repeat-containing protein [Pseudomonas sp. GM78]EJN29844.1 hypothetical protein PMI35_02298 [Pseudomonas sp. GM78]